MMVQLRSPQMEEALTVSELANFLRDVLKSGFPRAVWVCGEIQELREKNNHLYFTVSEKDKDSHQVVAKIGAIIWANTRPKIDLVLKKAENAFQFKEDIEVKLLCKVDFYPPFGQIRLIVEGIDPIYTLGKIAQDRQRLIAALKQKGTLDHNKRLVLPRVPIHIGLITSYGSAAYHDFTDELKRSGFGFKVFVVDAAMQGKNTETTVVHALKALNHMASLDIIVITRGGGSLAELSCFDSQRIAEAIAEGRLPVVSGIGHEINTTITDLAAHTFAKTPTAVAQFLIGRVEEFLLHVTEKQDELLRLAQEYLAKERGHLHEWARALQNGTRDLVKGHQHRMVEIAETLKRAPLVKIKQSRLRMGQYAQDLKKTIHLRLQKSRTKISNYQKLVEMADPKNALKRGFTITRGQDGKIVRSLADVGKTKTLTTVLVDGQVISDVVKMIKDKA